MRKRLVRFLCSRGVSVYAAEDAVQDVAERLLTHEIPHTNADDLMRWCMTVARNSAIDQHRRLRRSVPLDRRDADRADGSELVDMVEARMRLDRVLRALRSMSDDDVRCVMANVDGDVDGEVASPALRARRHRLRRRLSEMVGGFGLIGVVARALRPRAGRTTLGLSSAAVASVALVTVVTGGPHVGGFSEQLRLRVTPATAHVESVANGRSVVQTSAVSRTGARQPSAAGGPAQPAGPPGLHLRSPDKGGTIDIQGHKRRPSDQGLVCVDGLYFVKKTCVGPTLTAPHPPPGR